jgi:hypothetical protein
VTAGRALVSFSFLEASREWVRLCLSRKCAIGSAPDQTMPAGEDQGGPASASRTPRIRRGHKPPCTMMKKMLLVLILQVGVGLVGGTRSSGMLRVVAKGGASSSSGTDELLQR